MTLKKSYKKLLIQLIFLTPLIMCVATSIGIKSFLDHKFLSRFFDTENMFLFIVIVLFLNALASFSALVAYYCLQNRVDDILEKRGKNGKKKN